jgi:archaemetzincin
MPAAIVVHLFGEAKSDLVEVVRVALEQAFNVTVTLGEKLSVPARGYSRERAQYLSTELLNVLATQEHGDDRIRLGITDVDLFVPELNFVFGEASNTKRVAVFSTARLDPRAYGEAEDEAKLLRRATSEAVHELGHVFGLGHCTQPNCVMWFSNTLSETDRKGGEFCQRCAKQLGVFDLAPQ